MAITAEWRSHGEYDVVLVVENGSVKEAMTANPAVLHDYLSVLMPNVAAWEGDHPIDVDHTDPEAWGRLVMSREANGDVIEMDPEAFWAGVHIWFRSRGVDYNSPLLPASPNR
jgi:hypothetical protein